MIVGNVGEYIERCLRSFAKAVDEVCMVRAIGALPPDDTLDKAGEVCSEFGLPLRTGEYRNKPGHENWPHVDDFAAARQMSFDIAAHPYCLWCDSDDMLEDGGAQVIRELLEQPKFTCYIFPYRIFGRGVVVPRDRLILKSSGRWQYPVHEAFRYDPEPVSGAEDQRVVITHLPEIKKKGGNERNLRILRSIPEEEMTPGLWYHMQGELAYIKDIDGSVNAAKKALASKDLGKAERYEVFLNLFNMAEDPEKKILFLHQAYAADPLRREALGLLATTSLDLGNNKQAMAYARQMIATEPPQKVEWNHRPAAYGYVGLDIYTQALRANGKYAEAEALRWQSLKSVGGARVAIVHPTKGQPEAAARTRKIWWDMTDVPDRVEHVFCIDEDDADSQCLRRMHHVIIPKGKDWEWGKRLAMAATSAPVLAMIQDGTLPPLKWDNAVAGLLGDAVTPKRLETGLGSIRICTRAGALCDCEAVEARGLNFTKEA